MALLADRKYWDGRYTLDAEPFDWFQRYGTCKSFRDVISQSLKPTDSILIIGSGTSRLSEELYADNYRRIYNIDFSPVAVSKLNERYAKMGLKQIQNTVMDASSMDFNDSTFDVVIDKATLDSVLCAEEVGEHNAAKILSGESLR